MATKIKTKKAQATIFVIVSLIAVILIILFFILRTSIDEDTTISPSVDSANQYLSECVSEQIEEASKLIIENNGYLSKDSYKNYIDYKKERIPYFCYTSGFNTRCVTQEPVIMTHLEEEIYNFIEDKIGSCFDSLKKDWEDDGFRVSMNSEMSFIVELIPRNIRVIIKKEITLKKAEEEKTYETHTIYSQSPIYNLAWVTQRIVEEEAKYTNSDYVKIMQANTWADIDKYHTGSDDRIYTVKDLKTDLFWKFAVRGGVLETPA